MVTGKKAVKLIKDPAIKESFPLPDTGTCRHYKKSFHWLRYDMPIHLGFMNHINYWNHSTVCSALRLSNHYFLSNVGFHAVERPIPVMSAMMKRKITRWFMPIV